MDKQSQDNDQIINFTKNARIGRWNIYGPQDGTREEHTCLPERVHTYSSG